MSSFDTFTEDVDADNFSGYGGYTTGFPAGGDDYTGAAQFSTDDGDVPVTTSPGIFGFEDPNSESNYAGGNGHSVFESDGVFATDGPMLPPPTEMEPEEGYALREWRRENAMLLEEKEKREKELRNQILEEAEAFIQEFYEKRKVNVETNKTTNREREKVFLTNQEKFHKEADKQYWKAIADLIPNEVPNMDKRRGAKKEQDKKPSVTVVQGPKPGKPTDLSRLRHIIVKLKHSPPPHMMPPPPPAAPTSTTKEDGKKDGKAAPPQKAANGSAKDDDSAKENAAVVDAIVVQVEALPAVEKPPVQTTDA